MRTSLVISAILGLAVATPLSAQSHGRPRQHDHGQAHRREVRRDRPRPQPRARQRAPRARRAEPAPRRWIGGTYGRQRNARRIDRRDGYRDRDNAWFGGRSLYRDRGDLYRDRDDRYRLARPYEYGRFRFVGRSYRYPVVRIEIGAHRLWLGGGFAFEVAAWDWPFTAQWCWNCGEFVVLVDPLHPGWYLLYDTRLDEYVHARYLGD